MQSIDFYDEQSSNIYPRLCTLYKWPHYHGYGIHLDRRRHRLGLRIDMIEPDSPAENGGLLREDIVLAINGHLVEKDEFCIILSCIQYALEQDQIRLLVLDSHSAELAQRYQLSIDENSDNCIRIETSQCIGDLTELLNIQWRQTNNPPQTITQDISHDEVNDTNKLSSDINSAKDIKPELRMCSVILRPNLDALGISLEPDVDFGHIIAQVQTDSPAARAGIEQDDYIISLNHTSLIYLPFEDVLYFLKKKCNVPKLDFLLAKKSYLLQAIENQLTTNTDTEKNVLLNETERTRSMTLPATETSEKIYSKTNFQQQETISSITDEQYDHLSLQIYNNKYSAKHKKKHGKVHRGIGPATTFRSSWSARSEKTTDYASIHSDLYGRRSGTNEAVRRSSSMKVSFNLLQVGFTNPSPTLEPRRILTRKPILNSSDHGKKPTESPSFFKRHRNSSKVLPSSNVSMKNNPVVDTLSPSLKHNQSIPSTTPIQRSPAYCIEKQG